MSLYRISSSLPNFQLSSIKVGETLHGPIPIAREDRRTRNGEDIGRAAVGLRPEDLVETFGNTEDDVARPRVDGVPDETALVWPPRVTWRGTELGGDDRGDLLTGFRLCICLGVGRGCS